MSVKRIFSAGGIVLRPQGYDPVSSTSETGSEKNDGKWEVLVTQHSKHKGWDFPKGHLEVAESSEQAAVREVEEETGVKAEIIEKIGQTQYFYWEEGVKVFKTVTYFLMKYLDGDPADHDQEVADAGWFPLDEAETKLKFDTDKDVFEKAKKILTDK